MASSEMRGILRCSPHILGRIVVIAPGHEAGRHRLSARRLKQEERARVLAAVIRIDVRILKLVRPPAIPHPVYKTHQIRETRVVQSGYSRVRHLVLPDVT
jgi:hypothetical protein